MTVQVEVKSEVIDVTPQEEQYEVKSEGTFIKGDRGASAYEVAVANGFKGTEAEWLESLKGDLSNEEVAEIVKQAATLVKVPTKTSELENDSNFAEKTDIPQNASDVGADASGTAEEKVSNHNTDTDAHGDIRLLIAGLTTRLNALANSDDITLDQMAEVVAYIKSNRALIESVTTDKVNVTDIINNLTTNVANKPLSAAQGVVLKNLIDTLQTAVNAIKVPTKTSELTNDSKYVTDTELTAKGYAKQTDVDDLSEEIADLKGEVPDYWEEHLAGKIETIKALQRQYGKDCFSFVFMTDIHYPSNLGKRSPVLAKKIMDECNIRFTLNGGDNQTRGCYQTIEEIFSENKQVAEMFSPVKDRLLQIEGNHDGSYYWTGGTAGSGTSYAKQLTEQGMFEEYYRGNCLSGDAHFDKNSNAFYVDDVSNKVRYIGLNSMNVPNSKTDVNADGTAKYCKFRSYQFLQAQYDFLCNEALVNGLTDGWKVVVFGHSGIYNADDYGVMVDVLSAYKDKKPCTAEYIGTAGGGPAYTNQIPISTDASGNVYNGKGYRDGYRFNSSKQEATQSNTFITGFIPIKVGGTVYLNGNYIDASFANASAVGHLVYDSNKNVIQRLVMSSAETVNQGYSNITVNDEGYVTSFTLMEEWAYIGDTWKDIAFIRLNLMGVGEGCIVTVNEEIVESEHGYDYVSVDHDFTEAKGEFIAYFHGHDHKDDAYTRDSIKDISTRCDGKQENDDTLKAERVQGTITEQSFDVFTVTPNKIYATKIGAGSDRVIDY